MSSADTVVGGAEASPLPGPLQLLRQVLQSAMLVPVISALAAVLLGVGLITWALKPTMVPLMPRVGADDAARIVEHLSSRGERFQIDGHSGLILVPAARVQALQIELASNGVGASDAIGLEMLQQDQSLGTSQFMEAARYQHGLETELARTISNMRNVDTARVHLALPKRTAFMRKQSLASASVMVGMATGRTLERGQVKAIINLLASSVPYLESSNVTLVDQWGQMLSAGFDNSFSSENQFDYTRRLEEYYTRRVEHLLTPLVGQGKVRAQVSALVDFSVNEQTSEAFAADPEKIRSEQRSDQSGGGATGSAAGIPGALSNQPPEQAVIDAASMGGAPVNTSQSRTAGTSNVTRNYELDKTITHTRSSAGVVSRLSVAVIIDSAASALDATDSESEATGSVDISNEDIQQFTALVKEAIGFVESRGDTVLVSKQTFVTVTPPEPVAPKPVWQQGWVRDALKQLAAIVGVVMLLLFVFRPALRSMVAPPALATASSRDGVDIVLDDDIDPANPSADTQALVDKSHGDILLMAKAMATNDPKRVARVVKEWVSDDAEAANGS